MKLATIRITGGATRAVRVDDDVAVDLEAPDLGALLLDPSWRARAERRDRAAATWPVGEVGWAAVVPIPGKIVCVGLNYRPHILEMGRQLPEHPTLFAKYPEALVGPYDDIELPAESHAVDWEAELAVVIGRTVRRADDHSAAAAIAGFTAINDVTMRDWQYRTPQWLQGKTFESTTPLGPVLVTPDELPGGVRPTLQLTCRVDGDVVQGADTGDLVFDPVALVRYISTIVTLRPGDVIATGTPGGVGHARTPPVHLRGGQVVTTEIAGIGELRNEVRAA